MQVSIFSPELVETSTVTVSRDQLLKDTFDAFREVAVGSLLWFKGSWYDYAFLVIRTKHGWRYLMNTDPRWRAVQEQKKASKG